MTLQNVYGGIATNILLGGLLYGVNKFVENAQDAKTISIGVNLLTVVTYVILYFFISKWTTVRTWTFYLVIVQHFLTSCFDSYIITETWRKPNHFIMTEYLNVNDRHLHSIYVTMFVFFNGTVLHLINYLILYRVGNGKSIRSLLIFNTMTAAFVLTIYIFVASTAKGPLHPITEAFIPSGVINFALAYGALRIPRSSILTSKKQGTGPSSNLTGAFLAATGLIIAAKALVLQGATFGPLSIVRKNDPLILLKEPENNYSFAAVQIWVYVLVALPTLLICLVSQFSRAKPSYLWELSVSQAALIVTGQFFFIAGAFFWETPKELRVCSCNLTFWLINLIPVVAVLLQLRSLWPYRVQVSAEKAKQG